MNYYSLMKRYKEQMIDALNRFLIIPSVYDEKTSTKEMPFGKEVDNALKYIGDLGERFGFDVDYCDGYATELTIGEGDKLIGIFAHADVVPATGDWTSDPFTPTVRKNNLYARGSSDDKGPLIAAFYATKALHDAGLLRDYRVRIVVGGDEERGSKCLHHYFEVLHKEAPTYGFTPDSDFPLIYGEKGITDFNVSVKVDIPNVKKIEGGLASNAVNDKTKVFMDKDEAFIAYLKEKQVKFEEQEDGILFIGKAVHGSTPELGENAALNALKCLGDFYKVEKLSLIGEKLSDTTGKSFNGFSHSKLLGDTTYCVGIISYEKGELRFTVNFRYNESVDAKAFKDNFDKFFGVTSEMKEPSKVLLYDPKCYLVKTLLKAYRAETNDFSDPLTTGGGTYAKHAPNTVAFGALFPHAVSTMHEPDEYINLDDFFMSSVIYAHAIRLLGEKDEN
ncbi:MAG: Sapep family Mn(2+)-dependent dipeptidase [Bacilli bacterium]|nr:Sapep family Mn(2+)-dependent dipeptidase [Bacilli bacterium]